MAAKKKGLGRGLDALLGSGGTATAVSATPAPTRIKTAADPVALDGVPTVYATEPASDNEFRHIAVDLLTAGQYQPRKDMDDASLQELADSIKAQGVMQPIVVRPLAGNSFEIIAGERRWRASQLAGLEQIPALIKDVADEAAIAMALIENIQREDLNPMEEAVALDRLQSEFELTQQQVADAVGKSRSSVANLLRLMQLQDEVRTMLERGDLEMGHARALLALTGTEQISAARKTVGQGLNVRQTEALVRQLQKPGGKQATKPASKGSDIERLERELGEKIGLPVSIDHKARGKSTISFTYTSADELEGLLIHLR